MADAAQVEEAVRHRPVEDGADDASVEQAVVPLKPRLAGNDGSDP
jgi:hypothetical protein